MFGSDETITYDQQMVDKDSNSTISNDAASVMLSQSSGLQQEGNGLSCHGLFGVPVHNTNVYSGEVTFHEDNVTGLEGDWGIGADSMQRSDRSYGNYFL